MLRDFLGVEDKAKHETDVENINITTFDGAAGETPDKMLPKLMLTQPEVIVFSDLCNAATVNKLCEYANDPREGKLVVAGVRAQDACEALLRVLLLKADAKEFAKAVRAVLSVRLVRKLNDTCKQPYTPPPQLLAKLGIPAGRVKVLYKEWTPPPPPSTPEEQKAERKRKQQLPPTACPLCEQEGSLCHGLGYRGRTGIFELLEVNDQIREALVKQPKLEVLRQLARASRPPQPAGRRHPAGRPGHHFVDRAATRAEVASRHFDDVSGTARFARTPARSRNGRRVSAR